MKDNGSNLMIPKDRKVEMKDVATPNRVKRAGKGGTAPWSSTTAWLD